MDSEQFDPERMTSEERQAFFDREGYWPSKVVERKVSPKVVGTAGGGEDSYGPFFSSATAECFHREGCKWLRKISKGNRIRYESHLEARQAGKVPCKKGCAS